MNVLVTGASGFTGSHLARYLHQQRDQVRAFVRPTSSRAPLDGAGVEIVEGDLLDSPSLDRAMHGIDVVYHVAALFRTAGLPSSTYKAVNADAVAAVIDAAVRAGVRRVVHCSTVGVHGDVEHPPANEDAPLRPGDVYQETKLLGERLAREAAKRTGIELVIVRPTGIYGPGDRRLLKMFGAIARGRFVLLGNGQNYYHLTYIDDLCEGFRLCGTVAAAAGRTYILGGPRVTTLREIVDITARVAGRRPPRWRVPVWPVWLAGAACEAIAAPFGLQPPLYRRRVDFFRKSRSFDISRARQELGFDPQVDVETGIRRTLEWYRAHQWI
ncbi:MAG: NAD-dependent epimerase/dehydratase family protein [Acidobacteria bacterium]|nr:NAD-dependent epimerase/dehydratase family protein [Acidobacteriota bacterium]